MSCSYTHTQHVECGPNYTASPFIYAVTTECVYKKYQLSLTNRVTRCITANVLQTKVNAQSYKLVTELS